MMNSFCTVFALILHKIFCRALCGIHQKVYPPGKCNAKL